MFLMQDLAYLIFDLSITAFPPFSHNFSNCLINRTGPKFLLKTTTEYRLIDKKMNIYFKIVFIHGQLKFDLLYALLGNFKMVIYCKILSIRYNFTVPQYNLLNSMLIKTNMHVPMPLPFR